jgi:hypothetical protein
MSGSYAPLVWGAPASTLFYSPEIPVKLLPLFLIKDRGIKGRTWNWRAGEISDGSYLARWF